MPYELNGTPIACDANGYLTDINDWSEELAPVIAATEEIELTDKHMDVIRYLRDEYINNGQNQPNERTILKAMGEIWGGRVSSKDLYDLFPRMPSKQGGKIAGLPESRRKGGY
ncbi:MAG: TusE/DsrC/DsvC family sulfur relay protein [Proteobacteria bacterium]|nr:MAG: TusE/DsrC/DsvC family sulfur relay protein [Pseudomonadota bacterium]